MWGFGTISNGSDQILNFDYAVAANSSASGGQLNNTCGNAMIEIGSLGAIILTDMGNVPGGPHAWCVQVAWNTSTENFWYDGGGVINVKVDSDGSFALGNGDQLITGNINDDTVAPPGPDPTGASSAAASEVQ